MSQITLKQLEAFVQVAKLESFRKAARALNTTQPNISSRISKLEEQIGQVLLKRNSSSVSPTHYGKQLLEKAQKVLLAVDDLMDTSGTNTLFEGALRVGVTEIIAHSWLGQFLNTFSEAFPNVTLELRVDLSENLTAALADNEIDLALQNGPFKIQSENPIPLGSYAMTWVASPNFKAARTPIRKQDLAKQTILTHSRDTLPFLQLEEHFKAMSGSVHLVPSNSVTACLEMTRQGIGVACLPTAIVKSELDQGTLVELNYEWAPDNLNFEARYNHEFAAHYVKEAANIAAKASKEYQSQ